MCEDNGGRTVLRPAQGSRRVQVVPKDLLYLKYDLELGLFLLRLLSPPRSNPGRVPVHPSSHRNRRRVLVVQVPGQNREDGWGREGRDRKYLV